MIKKIFNVVLIGFAVFGMADLTLRATITSSEAGASVENVFPSRTDGDRTADRDAIRAHIEKIFQSYVNRDCDAIREAHAQNWIGFAAFSRTILRGRDQYMNGSARSCLERTPPDPNALVMVDYKISDMDFVFYGDVALVPYVAETKYGRTARLPGKLRSLDVYAKLNGAWIQVGSHLDLHPETHEAQRQTPLPMTSVQRQELLAAREAVWRSFFSNDREHLEKVIPTETIAINAGDDRWQNRTGVFESAAQFKSAGGKLIRLEFPRTDIQVYGDVAILYSNYAYELLVDGKSIPQAGRATETFVRRRGTWVNSGWHLDSGK